MKRIEKQWAKLPSILNALSPKAFEYDYKAGLLAHPIPLSPSHLAYKSAIVDQTRLKDLQLREQLRN